MRTAAALGARADTARHASAWPSPAAYTGHHARGRSRPHVIPPDQGHLVSQQEAEEAAADMAVASSTTTTSLVGAQQWRRQEPRMAHRMPNLELPWDPDAMRAGLLTAAGLSLGLAAYAGVRLLSSTGRENVWTRLMLQATGRALQPEEQGRLLELASCLDSKVVYLAGQALGDELFIPIAVQLFSLDRCDSADFRRNNLTHTSASLLSELLLGLKLQRLCLGSNPAVGDQGAAALAKLAPLLERISGNLDAVADWASTLSLGEQQRLASLGGQGLPRSRLVALDLSACEIGDEGSEALADMMANNPCLEEIDLSDNLVGARGTAAIARALQRNSTLKVLRMGQNYVTGEAAAQLGKALQKNRVLEEICLEDNNLGDAGVAAFCSELTGRAAGIAAINLSGNSAGPAGCKTLAGLLQGCTDVSVLRLRGSALGDDGAVQLAAALKNKRRLRHLDLTNCGIGPAGARALAAALRGNKCLRVLQMSLNPIGPDGVEAIADMVKAPLMAVEVVELRSCSMGYQAGPVVALFDMLRSTESLLLVDLRENAIGIEKLGAWCARERLMELEAGRVPPPDRCKLLLPPPPAANYLTS